MTDISVSFPARRQIRVASRRLFAPPGNPACQTFLKRVFRSPEVAGVTIHGTDGSTACPYAVVALQSSSQPLPELVRRIAESLAGDGELERRPAGSITAAERSHLATRFGAGLPDGADLDDDPTELRLDPLAFILDPDGEARFFRHGSLINSWEMRHDIPGRLRLAHPALHRRAGTCEAIDRELMTVLGVERSHASAMTGALLVKYSPRRISSGELMEILAETLTQILCPLTRDRADLHLPLCTLSIPVAAVATFAIPALVPAAAVLFAYTAIPTFCRAQNVVRRERRLGVDVLDSLVFTGCLATLSVFPGSLLCWSLEIGRELVRKTQDRSRQLLLEAFEKSPRHVWLVRDCQEIRVAIDLIQPGDTVLFSQGDIIAVDGVVLSGHAVIDQRRLTGEASCDPKSTGDRVYASTEVRSGQIHVTVELSGASTACARMGQAIQEASSHGLTTQHRGERMADQAVIPTLALGALGFAAMGPAGAAAVLNTDFSTGIRIAAPMALLSCLTLCARSGILVKDGHALEAMNEIDTIVIELIAVPERRRSAMPEIIANLHDRGIRNVFLLADQPDEMSRGLAESLGFDGHYSSTTAEQRARVFESLKAESRKTLYLAGTGSDLANATSADLTAIVGKATSLTTGSIQVVFLEEGLEKLCTLREIAAELDRTVRRSWTMIVAPNVACIAGIFTMGFGIIISEITNNVAALAAVANGLLPLKDFTPTESQPQDALQTRPAHGLDRKALRTQTQTAAGRPNA